VRKTGANVSVVFVPPPGAADAIMEAADAGLPLVVCITEGIPTLDMVKAATFLSGAARRASSAPTALASSRQRRSARSASCPATSTRAAPVGVVSRSGTLTYEAVGQLTALGIGQSTCIGIGGDPIIGTNHTSAMKLFNEDPGTEAIVMIGEIGGSAEEDAAAYVKAHVKKPVVGFIAGQTAPPGRRMGHAGAIIAGGKGTADEKMKAMSEAGIHVVKSPADIGAAIARSSRSSERRHHLSERTFSIIKPDAVKAGKAGQILARIEGAGFKAVALRMRPPDEGRGRGLLLRPQGAAVLRQPGGLHDVRTLHHDGAREGTAPFPPCAS
jgi:succinyl-CoA synthetase alpha subunit